MGGTTVLQANWLVELIPNRVHTIRFLGIKVCYDLLVRMFNLHFNSAQMVHFWGLLVPHFV